MKALSLVFIIIIMIFQHGFSHVIYVPDDYETIQDAIIKANNYDTVMVRNGEYRGSGNINIDFDGKAVYLKSENGPKHSIINCQGDSVCNVIAFGFHSNENNNTVVEGFTITGGWSNWMGGMVDCYESSPVFKNCYFLNSHVRYNGGAFYIVESSPILKNCVFENNNSSRGGGLYCYKSTIVVENCHFLNNSAYRGAAIYAIASNIVISHSKIIKNNSEYTGGAIYSEYCDSIIMDKCEIIENSGRAGAGIHAFNSSGTITNSHFMSNYSEDGGTFLEKSNFVFENCSFIENYTEHSGAGILGIDCQISLNDCNFIENISSWGGAGLFLRASKGIINRCLFDSNISDSHGGVIKIYESSLITSNNTYVKNESGSRSIICPTRSNLSVKNSIIANNYSYPIFLYGNDSLTNLNINCCNMFNNRIGNYIGALEGYEIINGNISENPMFCDTTNNDFHIASISPCAPENNECGELIGAFNVGCSITDIDENTIELLPDKYELSQNHPNPFNPSTTIEFSIPKRNEVSLEVFNILGQKVIQLINRELPAGEYNVNWDGTDQTGEPVSAGIYLYRLKSDDFSDTKKMTLIK